MTQVGEKIHINLDSQESKDCPFCPGEEDKHEWKTFKGKDNNGTKLRKAMNDPSKNNYAQEKGARPKDGVYPRQNEDDPSDP